MVVMVIETLHQTQKMQVVVEEEQVQLEEMLLIVLEAQEVQE